MKDAGRGGHITLDARRAAVETGDTDAVPLAMVDMQARLRGKRLTAEHFLNEFVDSRADGCNYQRSVHIEMTQVPGYRHASWSLGYGDFAYRPDLSGLRPLSWHPGSAFVMSDFEWADGAPVSVSLRQVLRYQVDCPAEHGRHAYAGTELEFLVFNDYSYGERTV